MLNTTSPLDNPALAAVQQRIHELEEALLAQDAKMPSHLKAIHEMLLGQDELVHLLTDDEIGKIVAAQTTLVGVVLKEEVSKSRKGSKVTADDL